MASDRILPGLGLRLFAVFCLSTMMAMTKLVDAMGAHLFEILFFRQLLSIPVALAWLGIGPDGIGGVRTARLGAHAWRTLAGLIGLFANFGAVLLLPLAEATTLQFTVPIFATVLGALVLHEHVGRYRWAAVTAGLIGVVAVAQPSGGHFPIAGTMVGLIGAFGIALVSILLRQLGKTESAGTTVFWFSLFSVGALTPLYLMKAQAHDPMVWLLLIGIGVAGGAGQVALTGALRLAPVSAVVPMDYSGLIWATLYGWILFAALPTPTTWLGAPLIVAAGLVILWRERVKGREISSGDRPA
ncbi:DMT family transporter [Sphingomonas canadensis]|uniref:DMT family transporter n=1 Tax=Sphingomonas canadensis TaxID=1219257 RepID=A0ABW3H4I9_9SPHN|nr:DMT family transporter [Sphingomonas canadensis]MCW3836089.1 DMT family transporter [Sphingomonas canadensis]